MRAIEIDCPPKFSRKGGRGAIRIDYPPNGYKIITKKEAFKLNNFGAMVWLAKKGG